MTQPWQNRITGYGEEAPDQLLANPSNFRTHPRHQQAALLGVLEDVGVVQDVIVSRNSGFIVDGHLRVMLALRTNQPTIPVKYVDLTPAEEALILASLDPISALAGTDAAKLSDLLHEVSTSNSDVLALLDGLATQAGIVPGLDPLSPGAGGDEFDTTPADGPTRTQRGELWSLGDHRLLVDDCTVAANVSWLMDGRRADMIASDPPYAIYGSSTGIGGDVTDDNMVRPFMRAVGQLVVRHSKLGAHIYLFCDWRSYAAWWDEFKPLDLVVRNCIVWDKGDGGLGSMYTMRHEFIVFSEHLATAITLTKANEARKARMVHGVANVQRFNVPQGNERHHNAAKPLDLVRVLIDASSDTGDLILDPFLGSGTTLIAAQRTGRICYGCEIEPRYADVILRRFEAETGQTAQKVEAL